MTVSAVNGAAANVGHAIATAHGTLTLNADGSYSYAATATPSSLTNGAAEDNASFTVSDANGNTTSATLSILVHNGSETLYVGSAGNTLNIGNANSVIDARAANETITAGNGQDFVAAGDNENITLGNGNDTVLGGANDHIVLGFGQDQLVAGFNDTWSVGTGSDAFIFNSFGFGDNAISGFNTGKDVIQFSASLFHNYSAVFAATSQVGSNAVVTDPQGDQVSLIGVTASHLTASNFKFS
jgi:VCBS repeat-containing protein